VQVYGEGPDIPKSIPDRPTYGQIHRLEFYCQPKTVNRMNIRDICIHGSQRTRNLSFANNTMPELRKPLSEFVG
jgi:hypothetical protein